ncbi:MAG: hypothetical protein WCI05_01775 [Myxococcales bacterium]
MPLARARCAACSLPLGDPPHVEVLVRCGRCATSVSITLAADGQPVDCGVAFSATRPVHGCSAARGAMASGTPGVAVGACRRCQTAVVVPPSQPVTLLCPHCREPRPGPAADMLLDLWPEPWCRIEGANLDIEYRLVLLDAARGVAVGCAACGAPTPPDHPSSTCSRCRAVTWVVRPDRSRVQLAVKVDGTREGRPFKALVPVLQGEMMLRQDTSFGLRVGSGSSVLGMTGLGCALALALAIMCAAGIGFAIYFSK